MNGLHAMTVFYSDTYTVPLPEGHRFPMHKYRMLREALQQEGVVAEGEFCESPPVEPEMLHIVHDPEYVASFCKGVIDPKAVRRIGIPWSPAFVQRTLASVGGTLAAARVALQRGVAGNIAGGTHHAFRGHGEGYCVFNDIAVATVTLLAEAAVGRVAVVDLDVHQGNGTAAILGNEPRAFTLSMHGAANYPFVKVPSTVDVALPDHTDDAGYLAELDRVLPAVFAFQPDLIFYQGGVDPLACDVLGRLSLTHEGLAERDRRLLAAARHHSVPVVLTLGGGYARPIEETVRAHVNTYRECKALYGQLA